MEKEIERFHGIKRGFIVCVCEGQGTQESVARIVQYVHDEAGNLLGKIDPAHPTH